MLKWLWTFVAVTMFILPVQAELTYQGAYDPDQSLSEYFQKAYPRYNKPIIYVFYNDVNMSCENCPQTIELIERVYNQKYQNKYDLYIIDYGNDQEYNFIQTYNLNQPLEVVLVRVDNGAEFGYKKLENLNYQISDVESFADNLEYQIEPFLSD